MYLVISSSEPLVLPTKWSSWQATKHMPALQRAMATGGAAFRNHGNPAINAAQQHQRHEALW